MPRLPNEPKKERSLRTCAEVVPPRRASSAEEMVAWPCASNCSRNRRYRESRRTVLSEIFLILCIISQSSAPTQEPHEDLRGQHLSTHHRIQAEPHEASRHDGGGSPRGRHDHVAQLLATPGETGSDERAECRDLFRRDDRLGK